MLGENHRQRVRIFQPTWWFECVRAYVSVCVCFASIMRRFLQTSSDAASVICLRVCCTFAAYIFNVPSGCFRLYGMAAGYTLSLLPLDMLRLYHMY